MERREVVYSGRVQGVGFRWTARGIAQSFAVSGFVKNLENGKVRLIAEGAAAELDAFLLAIAERFGPSIRETKISRSPPTGEFASFEIVH